MPVVEIQTGFVEHVFSFRDIPVDMRYRYRPEDGVQLIAERLSFFQIRDGELAFIAQQPRHNRRRIPIAPNRSLEDAQAEINKWAFDFVEVNLPIAGLFAD